jgi:hypothetical protein
MKNNKAIDTKERIRIKFGDGRLIVGRKINSAQLNSTLAWQDILTMCGAELLTGLLCNPHGDKMQAHTCTSTAECDLWLDQ